MKQHQYWGFLIVLLIISTNLFSQQRFSAAAVGGINLSQIDGDNVSGFNKFGWIGGLRASTLFEDHIQLDLELLFSQRGATSDRDTGFPRAPHVFDVQLNYAEIPVLFTFKWNEFEKQRGKKSKRTHYKRAVHGGITIGRVIQSSIEERIDINALNPLLGNGVTSWVSVEDKIQKTDISATFGFSIYLNRNVGIQFRSSTSLTPLYQPKKNNDIGTVLRNYYLTSMAFYEF